MQTTKNIRIDKCPFCGGEEFIECRMGSYGYTNFCVGVRHEEVYAYVCRDCGSAVRLYCKEPEKLYPKKERKN